MRRWRRCATFALIDRDEIADERDPSIKTDCIRLHRLVRQVAVARARAKRGTTCCVRS